MPYSTMHLWIAKKILDNRREKSSAGFLLGSIAPDAKKITKNTTKEDQFLSHLREPDFASGYANARKILADKNNDDFLMGCATHIMIDDLWLKGPYLSMQKSLQDKFSKKEIDMLYKKDCKYIELWLFRQNTSRLLWTAVMNAPLERFFDILTPGEIDAYRKDRLLKLNKTKISFTSKYITLDIAYQFMDEAALKIANEINTAVMAQKS